MAQKAVLLQISNGVYDGSTYTLAAEVLILGGAGGSIRISVNAASTSFDPTIPNWRSRFRTAIINKAASEHGMTVDDVLFPDFGILSV
jgi:hypothetical protein